LLLQLARARRGIDQARAGRSELRLVGDEPRLGGSFWYWVGSIRNSSSPLFTRRLGSTGTSRTRPRTCGTICTTYLTTRTSAVEGATTLSVRINAVSATIGMITAVTCVAVFHGNTSA
jgi:hypothetical protein